MKICIGIVAVVLFAAAAPALADPCKAIPDKGPKPSWIKLGAPFSGPVTYVGDGDGLCVAVGEGPAAWVEVRLSDFSAPELHEPRGREAKSALESIAMGREVTCTPTKGESGSIWTWDRVVAVCRLDGVSLGDQMRAAGVAEGGRGKAGERAAAQRGGAWR